MATIEYDPNLAANVIMAAIFALVLLVQIGFGIRYKTWGFMVGMIGGNTLEVIGYIGRIQLSKNPFSSNAFLMYLVCLTIAPAFLSASIYLCLSRIVVAYGEGLSRFKPGTYTIMFICFDFIALLLQAAGGAIASIADSGSSMQDAGIDLMIAGVSWQVASLAGFIAMCLDFFLRVRKATPEQLNPLFSNTRRSVQFRGFLCAVGIATLFIFIRSVYRTAELSQGFKGSLANDEVTFMILEATMIALAVIALTVMHPGIAFRGQFADAGWTIKRKSTGMKLEKLDDENTEYVDRGHAPSREA